MVTRLLFIFLLITPVYAEEIHLKDGTIIETDNYWESGDEIRYEKWNITVGVKKSDIKEIRQSDYVQPPPPSSTVPTRSYLTPTQSDYDARMKRIDEQLVLEDVKVFTEGGYVHATGKVVNYSDNVSYRFIKVIVDWKNSYGEVIGKDYGYAIGDLWLLPGQSVTVEVMTRDSSSITNAGFGIASYKYSYKE